MQTSMTSMTFVVWGKLQVRGLKSTAVDVQVLFGNRSPHCMRLADLCIGHADYAAVPEQSSVAYLS